MNYAIIENNKVTNIVIAEPEYAAEQGWVGPITRESKITFGWGYVNGKFVEPPRDIEAEWEAVRTQRDKLLLESDVYVLPDRWAAMTTEEQTAWSEYRQALRDIPQVYTDPADVIWPTKPTT